MNKFHQRSKAFQWVIALTFLICVGALLSGWFYLLYQNIWYLLLVFFLGPIFQFAITPFLTLIGNYKYLSSMFLVYNPSNTTYELHNGTSFDYLMVFYGYKTGRSVRNKILEYYLEGLLKLIDEIERNNLSEKLNVMGSSYFFSDKTAQNLGFELSGALAVEKINIFINYLDLMWMYSVANGKLAFPNLNNVKNAKITGKKLVERKLKLEGLHAYLVCKNKG